MHGLDIFMLKNSTTSAPETTKQPIRVRVKTYFFHKLFFGGIKLSDLNLRSGVIFIFASLVFWNKRGKISLIHSFNKPLTAP